MLSITHRVHTQKHICLNYSPLLARSLSQIPQLDNYTYKSQLTLTLCQRLCTRVIVCVSVFVPLCVCVSVCAGTAVFICPRGTVIGVCVCACTSSPLCLFSKVQQRGPCDQHHPPHWWCERFPWQPGALVSRGGWGIQPWKLRHQHQLVC